ncbi:MAG: hypothetical protein ABW168_01250 [Sedimenticola sp.]
MDFNLIISELNQASTFELFRLKAAIDNFLDDPARLAAIKRALHPGMEISYFDQRENRLIPARLQKIHKTRAEVEDLGGGKCWTIPLYMINIEGTNTEIAPQRNGVDRLSLQTGDPVGFTGRDGEELFGVIIKLNPKRAKIRSGNTVWAVPYSMLFTVIDGEVGPDQLNLKVF